MFLKRVFSKYQIQELTSLKDSKFLTPNQRLNCKFSQSLSTTKIQKSNKRLKVDFYFDTVSPYTWPAFEVLCRYRDIWGLDINYKPVLLGGLTTAASNQYLTMMAECPNKASYNFRDLETRTAKYNPNVSINRIYDFLFRFFNIPFRMKEDPFNLIGVIGSLQQQRFITAVLKSHPEYAEDVIRNFWIRAWSEDLDVHTPEDIKIIAEKSGMDKENIQECFDLMKTAPIKEELKAITTEAVDRGAFGSPTMYFTDHDGENEQMFWGSDRFEMVAAMFDRQWLGPDPNKK